MKNKHQPGTFATLDDSDRHVKGGNVSALFRKQVFEYYWGEKSVNEDGTAAYIRLELSPLFRNADDGILHRLFNLDVWDHVEAIGTGGKYGHEYAARQHAETGQHICLVRRYLPGVTSQYED